MARPTDPRLVVLLPVSGLPPEADCLETLHAAYSEWLARTGTYTVQTVGGALRPQRAHLGRLPAGGAAMSDYTATNGVHHATDEALDHLYAWMPPDAPAPAPLPEAAFSLTLKGHLGGIDALLTVRGQTVAEFQRHLEAVRGLLDAPQPPASHRRRPRARLKAGVPYTTVP